jgi:hypothetical protein
MSGVPITDALTTNSEPATRKHDREDKDQSNKRGKKEESEDVDTSPTTVLPSPPPQPSPPLVTQITIKNMIDVGYIGPVTINGINFYLLGKLEGIDNRGFDVTAVDGSVYTAYLKVAILSGDIADETNQKLFWAYQSNSEAGMWRVCFTTNFGYKLDKLIFKTGEGDTVVGDYVQTTLIVIELQRFINENYSRLVSYNNPITIPLGDGTTKTVSITRTDIPEGLSHYKYDPPIPSYPPNTPPFHIINCNEYDPVKEAELHPMNREIRHPLFNPTNSTCGTRIKCVEGSNEDYHELARALSQTSENIKSNYEIVDNICLYPDYSSVLVPDPRTKFCKIRIEGEIYFTKLRSKIPNESNAELNELKLIYLRTTAITGLVTRQKSQLKPNYYMPIALLPATSVCNSYGVYSRYINAGLYICKLFDYLKQCTEIEKRVNQCTETYTFIGDRYLTLFPYYYLNAYWSRLKPCPSRRSAATSEPSTSTSMSTSTAPATSAVSTSSSSEKIGGRKSRLMRKGTRRKRHRITRKRKKQLKKRRTHRRRR